MPKHFSEAINEIMPLVRNGSDLPFVISREDGNWNINYFSLNTTATPEEIKAQAAEFIAFLREKDPYIEVHTGMDFARGSFSYVYDKVFCARLRAEYDTYSSGEKNHNEINALINAVEDSISGFSQKTLDYLLDFDQPLHTLYELNPIPLYNRENPGKEPYDEDRLDDFIGAIERKVDELTEGRDAEPAVQPVEENREHFSDANLSADDYKEINKISINDSDIILSENPDAEYRYMVVENRFTEYYNNSGNNNIFTGHTNDYLEAITEFTKRAQYNIDCVQSRQDSLLRSEEIDETVENIPSNADKAFLDRIHYLSGEYNEPENAGQYHLLKFIESNIRSARLQSTRMSAP